MVDLIALPIHSKLYSLISSHSQSFLPVHAYVCVCVCVCEVARVVS